MMQCLDWADCNPLGIGVCMRGKTSLCSHCLELKYLLNLLGARVFHRTGVKMSKAVEGRQGQQDTVLEQGNINFLYDQQLWQQLQCLCVYVASEFRTRFIMLAFFSWSVCFPGISMCEGGLSCVINYRTQERHQCCFPRKFQLFCLDCC